jgi:hypothetical protein
VAGNAGGGLGNDVEGTATVTNSTVSGNTGGWGGGDRPARLATSSGHNRPEGVRRGGV